MTERNHFNACPKCNRLMSWQTITQSWATLPDGAMAGAAQALPWRDGWLWTDAVGKAATLEIESGKLLLGTAQDELVLANATTKSGLAGLLLIALVEQTACIRARIRAILNAVQEERKPDGENS